MSAVRLTKNDLRDLIESTEAAGCDAACLRGLLAEVEGEEEQRRQPATRREVPPGERRGIPPEEITPDEEYVAELRSQSPVEHGTDLECMVCHERFDELISGTCQACFRQWALSIKKK